MCAEEEKQLVARTHRSLSTSYPPDAKQEVASYENG